MLAASSVRFLVKDKFSIFTKQSDKPFSAYADRWQQAENRTKWNFKVEQ
jgi:hypothetical protein